MRNERLFDKIKEMALSDNAGTEDFDSEKIWANVEKKQSPKTIWLWWHYAAASVVLLIICSVWILKPESQQALISKNTTPALPPESQEKTTALDSKRIANPKKRIAIVAKSLKNQSDKKDYQPENSISENANTVSPAPQIGEITAASQQTESSIVNKNAIADSLTVNPRIEKVLIADIALPEEKNAQQSAFQRIFDQVKKDREARKMRLQFDRNVAKPTFWSFVQQSFVENPSVLKTDPPRKKSETKP